MFQQNDDNPVAIEIQLCDEKGNKPQRLSQKIRPTKKQSVGDTAAHFFALNARTKHRKSGDVRQVLSQ